MSPMPIGNPMGGGIVLLPASMDRQSTRLRLTRRCILRPASQFVPISPEETPETHFRLQTIFNRSPFPRLINRYNSKEILLVIDGSCLHNGGRERGQEPTAGSAFIYKTGGVASSSIHVESPAAATAGTITTRTTLPFIDSGEPPTGKVGFRLETQGPDGTIVDHTSNRAKLRAVIAALEFRAWHGEGWRSIVIATDLEYVVYGATKWLPIWVRRRWKNSDKRKIANRDMWEEMQGRIETLRAYGTEVSFWLLPSQRTQAVNAGAGRSLIKEAKDAARQAASIRPDEVAFEFTKIHGILV